MATELGSTKSVIDALGGLTAIRDLTGSGYKAAKNWEYGGRFPAKTYALMTSELRKRGYSAPAELWGQQEMERVTEAERVAS